MGRSGGRSAEEVEKVIVDFERSGLSRREYSERSGIALPTLDWYRRRVQAGRNAANLVRVRTTRPVRSATAVAAPQGFALTLSNACRIESSWNFDGNALARLIRIAGSL